MLGTGFVVDGVIPGTELPHERVVRADGLALRVRRLQGLGRLCKLELEFLVLPNHRGRCGNVVVGHGRRAPNKSLQPTPDSVRCAPASRRG